MQAMRTCNSSIGTRCCTRYAIHLLTVLCTKQRRCAVALRAALDKDAFKGKVSVTLGPYKARPTAEPAELTRLCGQQVYEDVPWKDPSRQPSKVDMGKPGLQQHAE